MTESWKKIELEKISGLGEFELLEKKEMRLAMVKVGDEMKAFLVERKNTIEVRTDGKLAKMLKEKYESVMESRYFGRGGIEIVLSGQLEDEEIEDLVRLSYNLTKAS